LATANNQLHQLSPKDLKKNYSEQEVSNLWIMEIIPTTTHPPKKGKCLAQANSGDQWHHILRFHYYVLRIAHKLQADMCYDMFHVTYLLILPLVQPFNPAKSMEA
jgi:hypothetical protein